MGKKIIFCALTFVLLQLSANKSMAQSIIEKWRIGINAGVFVYQGELAPSHLGSYKTLKPALNIYYARILTPSFSLRTNLALGSLKGDESLYSTPAYRQQRNLAFHTPIAEVSEMLVWNIFGNSGGHDIDNRFSPYIFVGAGITFINVTRSANMNKSFFVREPEVIANVDSDFRVTPPRVLFSVPIGLGVEYYVNKRISLTLETNIRYLQTDYLDGFSKISNARIYDFFQSHTIGLVYKFGKDNKLDCPPLR